MSMTPEEKFNGQVWEILQDIKEEILATEKGKRVEYIGFSHQPSVAMVANCSTSRLLTKEDLLVFVPTQKREK